MEDPHENQLWLTWLSSETYSTLFFSLSGEGGEDNPGSADQAIDEAAAGLESRLEEEDEEDDDVVDLRAFSAIGPLMFIELLDLPPQPKVVNGWIMQQSKCYDLNH